MFDYYKVDVIPIILNRFKVNNVVISGLSDESVINHILKYCDDQDKSYIAIDSNEGFKIDFVQDYTLNILPDLDNYDAIFLNDDPNWYTVYNELEIIQKNNNEFPLVFICHNIFPHKRRDSYINPDIIPEEFINSYTDSLNFHGISLQDEFYHAIEESNFKNGVLTAIEDFLSKNDSIGLLDFKLGNGITILYPKNSISHIRLGLLSEEIKGYDVKFDEIYDNIFENQLLIDNIPNFNEINENLNKIEEFNENLIAKDKIISDYKNKIRIHNDELDYKNSQIESFDSQLDLKDSKIANVESKLVNRETEIDNLNREIHEINDMVNSLKDSIVQKEMSFKNQETKLNNQIKIKEEELNEKELMLCSVKKQYFDQLSKLDNREYCISCFKEEMSNNHLEIRYLKEDTLTKKILSPFAYVFLFLKSNPKEIFLNFKLYKALKNSKCFDIGFYLNNNKDILESKWCKYFSPELHYVCNGFKEERKFNKKYFNRKSKKDLLNYILNCNY